MEEENNYFKNVIKDALDDLKNNKKAYVFYEEQVQAVKELFKGKLLVEKKDDIFYLTAIKKCATI